MNSVRSQDFYLRVVSSFWVFQVLGVGPSGVTLKLQRRPASDEQQLCQEDFSGFLLAWHGCLFLVSSRRWGGVVADVSQSGRGRGHPLLLFAWSAVGDSCFSGNNGLHVHIGKLGICGSEHLGISGSGWNPAPGDLGIGLVMGSSSRSACSWDFRFCPLLRLSGSARFWRS